MKKDNSNRWRCLVKGCNPKLYGEEAAVSHKEETGHRVAKWPVRSQEGEKKAAERNRTGYYRKYNNKYKMYDYDDGDWQHPFTPEALGQD